MKEKYGLSTRNWSPKLRETMGSVEGFMGSAGFSGKTVAKNPSELFSVLLHVYGVRTNWQDSFEQRIFQAQAHISALPRKSRQADQNRARASIAEIGLAAFGLEARRHVDTVGGILPSKTPAAKAPPAPKAVKALSRPPAVREKSKFYKSWEWRTLRMQVLKKLGPSCMCCGAERGDLNSAGESVKICVDHVKPIATHWHLRLEESNLQILCDECNQGKGAWDDTDWRGSDLIAEQLRYVI